jgi:hypothetical protein
VPCDGTLQSFDGGDQYLVDEFNSEASAATYARKKIEEEEEKKKRRRKRNGRSKLEQTQESQRHWMAGHNQELRHVLPLSMPLLNIFSLFCVCSGTKGLWMGTGSMASRPSGLMLLSQSTLTPARCDDVVVAAVCLVISLSQQLPCFMLLPPSIPCFLTCFYTTIHLCDADENKNDKTPLGRPLEVPAGH